jgi:hypothetical protein
MTASKILVFWAAVSAGACACGEANVSPLGPRGPICSIAPPGGSLVWAVQARGVATSIIATAKIFMRYSGDGALAKNANVRDAVPAVVELNGWDDEPCLPAGTNLSNGEFDIERNNYGAHS